MIKQLLLLATLALPAYAVTAGTVEQSWPLLIVADEQGVPVPGVSKSTSQVNALEKVINLPNGLYKIIRPNATITVTGGDTTALLGAHRVSLSTAMATTELALLAGWLDSGASQ